ncbi:MAG: hypothetical protein Q4A00_08330 [Flavobacteriaceae bacterium]|nr:hypothetical protein [Flavobacteriaceae bacterium]
MNFKVDFSRIFMLASLVFILFTGCRKDVEEQKVAISSDELSQNENFLAIVDEMKDYSHFIKEIIEKSELSPFELENRVQIVLNSDLPDKDKIKRLNSLFGIDLTPRIEENARVIAQHWKIIDNKFNNIDEELLAESFAKRLSKNNKNSRIIVIPGNDCDWKYYACLAAAYSAAVLCHAGCDTTALATTAGLGIPACVALCGSLQIYASVECYHSYCSGNN